ncbi:MAG: LacI family transcriptional regulator [Treponema sp.]|jgi:DNA-binding LacI/PurR family transcriptional regulator|nr:LacI family transcriptional regulator [Treponema sp.]
MVTIHDVAKRAEVSISTVSNVINKNKYVSEDLVRRVSAAVKELEYTANPIAQKMKFKYTKTIGVIVSDIGGLFFPYIIKGMYDVLNLLGYRLVIMDSEGVHDSMGSVKKLREGITSLIQDRVDGIVFASTLPKEMEAGIIYDLMKRSSSKRNTALVCVDNDLSKYGITSVYSNSVIGADLAVSHLVDVGCRRIGHITGPLFFSVVQDRITGYKNVLGRNNLSIDDGKMISSGDYTHKSGYLAMKDLLTKIPDIDGVFVANDQMSVGALKAIFETGKRVPEEIKVIGYDDVFISSVLEPSLSTIHIQKHSMGKKAAELLIKQLENGNNSSKPESSIEIAPKLVIRKSTVKNAPDDWILVDW